VPEPALPARRCVRDKPGAFQSGCSIGTATVDLGLIGTKAPHRMSAPEESQLRSEARSHLLPRTSAFPFRGHPRDVRHFDTKVERWEDHSARTCSHSDPIGVRSAFAASRAGRSGCSVPFAEVAPDSTAGPMTFSSPGGVLLAVLKRLLGMK